MHIQIATYQTDSSCKYYICLSDYNVCVLQLVRMHLEKLLKQAEISVKLCQED